MTTAVRRIRLTQPRLWQRVSTLVWVRRALWSEVNIPKLGMLERKNH
jgi:hypothetical protein